MSDEDALMSWDEVMETINMLVAIRYPGFDGMDFLAAFSEGTAEERFPNCDDLCELAEVLEG